MSDEIVSIQQFFGKISCHKDDDEHEWFYRGHYGDGYELQPRLFWDKRHAEHEGHLFREIQVLCPADFDGDSSALEMLVRMQHYSLPTRLLDITSNPLIALYFACTPPAKAQKAGSPTPKRGEVFAFKIRKERIKFFDSDTISCIANLAKLNHLDREEIHQWISFQDPDVIKYLYDRRNETAKADFKDLTGRLLHFIKEEKPYYEPLMKPQDMTSVVCVRTKLNNTRIASQVGAFLLFGLGASIPRCGTKDIVVETIPIDLGRKDDLLDELDALDIKDCTVFPDIDHSAQYLSAKYATLPTRSSGIV